jgi:DNA-binding transcriptional MocR family regulator
MPDVPGYLRIAGDLRARIVAGDLPPGAKLPSETALMGEYHVSRTVAKYAINVLKGEGLVEGRRGPGRRAPSPDRHPRSPGTPPGPGIRADGSTTASPRPPTSPPRDAWASSPAIR